ncbi:3-hydroxyacyl-CoA dehydrogenase NAD-binding domain-containing protein [Flavilitoribacter nigricans]|uniref:Hydroxylacyl-CoA dehydrogenase n=1 Tax=Flavilitoribacter nigricans (strain ATCC 23147 / DSM 23189 / NBRC 102662 / NCIMB 1420 / SS-2) TaxID=1122177 RepID=A0A2D0N1V4_FLAN2|nr:3-hydroxyacyl-CoA dehydrogenase NAD-binding domain-containing protein [Flavilitoribacter nigricans]PHN02346.1 hydroxylacyl-CoA dehydrogenase [Flavilitoribacter nigricans DSM 23189 = NBRC 102662]
MKNSRHTIAVVGGGMTGSSWAALFAMRGDIVRIVEARPEVAATLKPRIMEMLKQSLGVSNVFGVDRNIEVYSGLEGTLDGVYAIQEAVSEQAELKQQIFAEIEKHAPPNALILSSSSAIPASVAGEQMEDPSRLIIGHPFHPPHILPLVEVVAGPQTDYELVEKTLAFYRAYGRVPVQLYREVPGFVANRLLGAVVLEAADLINRGIVNAGDLDTIITNSLGLRWAAIGPVLAGVLSGMPGGIEQLLKQIIQPLTDNMGKEPLPDEVIEKICRQAAIYYPKEEWNDLARRRDQQQGMILKIQKRTTLSTLE